MIKASNAAQAKKTSEIDLGSPKRLRAPDPDRRAAILDCAEQVFLEEGFQAASMAAIAARLGGSKGTLYNYFPSKEELFIACVTRQCAQLQGDMSSLIAEGGDLRETLLRVGRRYVEMVSSEDLVRKFRMIAAEAERAPELGRAFYEMGPARGARSLADYLEKAAREGKVQIDDPMQAAHHFLSLCLNRLSKARVCNYLPEPTAAEVDYETTSAVRVFLAAYAKA